MTEEGDPMRQDTQKEYKFLSFAHIYKSLIVEEDNGDLFP